VIVLTAIVVGVSLTAVGLALCIRIYDEYGTLRVDTLRDLMREEGSLPARADRNTDPESDVRAGGDVRADGGETDE